MPQRLVASPLFTTAGGPMDFRAWATEMEMVCGFQTVKEIKVLFTPYPSLPGESGSSVPLCWSLAMAS